MEKKDEEERKKKQEQGKGMNKSAVPPSLELKGFNSFDFIYTFHVLKFVTSLTLEYLIYQLRHKSKQKICVYYTYLHFWSCFSRKRVHINYLCKSK